jgi:hypothetical protein
MINRNTEWVEESYKNKKHQARQCGPDVDSTNSFGGLAVLVVLGRPARAFVGVTILFMLAGSHRNTGAKKNDEGYCSFFHFV